MLILISISFPFSLAALGCFVLFGLSVCFLSLNRLAFIVVDLGSGLLLLETTTTMGMKIIENFTLHLRAHFECRRGRCGCERASARTPPGGHWQKQPNVDISQDERAQNGQLKGRPL